MLKSYSLDVSLLNNTEASRSEVLKALRIAERYKLSICINTDEKYDLLANAAMRAGSFNSERSIRMENL